MHIQCPPLHAPSNWPHRTSSLLRRTPLYKSPTGKRFLQNKIWNCTLLAQYADDCAFVGLDVDGVANATATQIGLVYLPQLPSTTPIPEDLIRGQRPPDLMRNFGAEVWCLNLDPPEEAGRTETPKTRRRRRCVWATQVLNLRAAAVEAQICELLSKWKAQSGKKYLVLVGFNMPVEFEAMATLFPAAATTGLLDGWTDAQDLARDTKRYIGEEAVRQHMQKEPVKPWFPALATMAANLGITGIPSPKHNAATDAIMAVAVMIAAWNAYEQGMILDIPLPRSQRGQSADGK
ncbi:hypothetical protein PG997_008068 [Apiospora hydei]|uniref:Uncharacterized protein n=1 Tax=Apiospora hydei TaxID=1337664 RepID=A0ABR1W9Q8_9PEZI